MHYDVTKTFPGGGRHFNLTQETYNRNKNVDEIYNTITLLVCQNKHFLSLHYDVIIQSRVLQTNLPYSSLLFYLFNTSIKKLLRGKH